MIQGIGAAVHLPPNANGILRRWGIHPEAVWANPMDRLIERMADGRIRKDLNLIPLNKQWQHPWHLVHRMSLQELLKQLAVSDGAGIPVTIHTSSRVVEVDTGKGRVTLESGETVTADVVIGADGIYVRDENCPRRDSGVKANLACWQSKTRDHIKETRLFGSGKAAFRFLLPRELAKADPITAPLVDHKNTLVIWYSADRRIVMYPCNNNTLLNFVCIHPDSESHAARSDGENSHEMGRQKGANFLV